MKGDALAAGAKTASFSQGTNVTQERWDEIFGPQEETRMQNNIRVCLLHPAYRGRIRPHVNCNGCRLIYEERHATK